MLLLRYRVRERACACVRASERKSGGRERQRREAEEHQSPAEEPTRRMIGDSDVAVVFILIIFYFSPPPFTTKTFDSASWGKKKTSPTYLWYLKLQFNQFLFV